MKPFPILLAYILFALIFSELLSCKHESFSRTIYLEDNYFKGQIRIEKIEKLGRYCLSIKNLKSGKSDKIYTPYEVFQMDTGDVNKDGRTDILLGIIKPTPFDSILKKRLFIFQIDKDFIRPLWLSSRLVHPMVKFRVMTVRDAINVITIEKESSDKYCVAAYQWGSFGMHWIKNFRSSLTLEKADQILSQQ